MLSSTQSNELYGISSQRERWVNIFICFERLLNSPQWHLVPVNLPQSGTDAGLAASIIVAHWLFAFHSSRCCHLLLSLLGALSCTALGLHVGDEVHGRSSHTKHLRVHHVCFWYSLLRLHLRESARLQHHEQQIPTSFQGNFDGWLQFRRV